VLYSSISKLVTQEAPDPSLIGIIVAIISLMIMYPLARAKHRLGHELGSRSLQADAVETIACMWLSGALLVGLGLNYLWGIWWADPVAGIVIAGFLFNEGREVLSGEEMCGCGADHGEKQQGTVETVE
jgi:divalent metal cation (Fe/Co/Zn/Cd) transporter